MMGGHGKVSWEGKVMGGEGMRVCVCVCLYIPS